MRAAVWLLVDCCISCHLPSTYAQAPAGYLLCLLLILSIVMFQTLRIHIESLQPTFDCCVSTAVVDVKEKESQVEVEDGPTPTTTDGRTSQTRCCCRDELRSLYSYYSMRERNRVGDGRSEGKTGQTEEGPRQRPKKAHYLPRKQHDL